MAGVALRTEYVLITNPKPCVHSFLPAGIFDPRYQTASISPRNFLDAMHKNGQPLTPCLPPRLDGPTHTEIGPCLERQENSTEGLGSVQPTAGT